MAKRDDYEDLIRVGPGTVMGDFIRHYWLPCMLSNELQPGAAPIRLPLMGERLVAFRTGTGEIGVMDQRCPHRCASLFLGRNEEDGLRCVYHGWKFDALGRCIDMPSVPDGDKLKARMRAKAYRTAERNGLVWVYMGPHQDAPPPLPDIEANLLPESEISYSFIHRDCNWLQALEGDIDTSHFGFLHVGTLNADDLTEDHPFFATVVNRTPDYEVVDTAWGTSYGAFRPLPNGEMYWRTANFMLPFWTQNPAGDFNHHVHARAWVPIDDERMMFINIHWKNAMAQVHEPFGRELKSGKTLGDGYEVLSTFQPNSPAWFGRWRLIENEANDWLIDREAQRDGTSFTCARSICRIRP